MALSLSREYDLVDAKPFDWDAEGRIKLWIAPTTTNKGWQDAMTAIARWEDARSTGFRRGVRDSAIREGRTERMKKAAAQHLIVRWEGVRDLETGEEVEYTPELGLDLMTDPEKGDAFFADVLTSANNVGAFRREAQEEAAKNSAALSDGGESSESASDTTPKTGEMRSVS